MKTLFCGEEYPTKNGWPKPALRLPLKRTLENRFKFYDDQINRFGYFTHDGCKFFPGDRIVFKNKEFPIGSSSFLRSYGYIEMRKKDFGLADKIKREVSLNKIPQFSTLTDADVIFYLLEKYMGLRWSS